MTRMSPGRPRATPVDASSVEGVLLDARWRVGPNLSLSLVVTGDDASSRVTVRIRTPDGMESITGAVLDSHASEWTLRADATAGLPAFTLACIVRAEEAALVVTDLPARIGLLGGTYELERVVA